MNGSLLEEASKHYFGKSDEFLVDYAAGLGSTVISWYGTLINPNEEENPLAEYLDLQDDADADADAGVGPEDNKPVNYGWPVSSKANVAYVSMTTRLDKLKTRDYIVLRKNTSPGFKFMSGVGIVCCMFYKAPEWREHALWLERATRIHEIPLSGHF